MSGRAFVGTSGWSYTSWRPKFYPEGTKSADFLRHYATRFRTIEINYTFNHLPTEKGVAVWTTATSEDFVFGLKASQQITHRKRLKDAGDAVSYFLQVATTLGDRLGPVLFQLPPNLKKDLPRLTEFLAGLPRSPRAAFEFRHESWFDEEVFTALSDAGAALCWAEDEGLATPHRATAEWGFLRLRRPDYGEAEVAAWADRIRSQTWSDAYVFFKHEDEGAGPRLAGRLREILA